MEQKKKIEYEFAIYNEFLDVIGGMRYVEADDIGYYEFNIDKYKTNVRPILFKNLHLLPYSIVEKIRGIDVVRQKVDEYEDLKEWLDDLSQMFSSLVIEIEQQYKRIQ
ncbi:hypothetical protein A8L34_05050 [Bacillus sp. FJAT-27264]|uniref:hypothetical protein n=1 Tax=Paenibacillus sp. (strain DSM 101736 / FJAT-27264) TaxID=1850362 RepID=UPI000807FCFF|nr:hypothetical protein [Bacillus sp. FJAT-27264]OBZ18918.1 hypothetical protein A8L34_05050 [Bacillus sp. FJAT-27264]